ncbi:polyphosphate polymerase domain-containing protein [Nocardiopsis halotolerans]|uniref:polyphosphate polymerase domain-containing protein n=1 Tax=Nocardiopsis halotolerans TaxID=124252 RepID=UPI0003451807|nr:polyphosphate polymerase domain-containing protein [Nocardiopsis halotolerans]
MSTAVLAPVNSPAPVEASVTVETLGPVDTPAPVDAPPPALAALRPMSLAEINERAALVTRTCRKYLVPAELLNPLFAGAGERFGVLTIDGRREFRYSSTYLDTPGLRTFQDHRQGRRVRFKARTRTYVDTDTRMFEIKLKGARGITDKTRISYAGPPDRMTPEARRFLDDTLLSYGVEAPDVLEASAVTDYRRTTVVAFGGEERVTVDTALVGYRCGWSVRMRPDMVLLEVKTRGGLTPTERRLHEHGFREARFTKYGATVAALEPRLRGNRWHRAMGACLEPPVPSSLERARVGTPLTR